MLDAYKKVNKDKIPLIYITAGEASGDALGAKLMNAIKQRCNGRIKFAGIGGDLMTAAGLESLFPMQELSVMGIFEILPHIKKILRRIKQAANHVDGLQPDIIITIDSPGFSHRFIKKIKFKNITKIHYVAPSVWAWRKNRVYKFKKHFDYLLALLPFEPSYFKKVGLECYFVGHSIIESGAGNGDGAKFRQMMKINDDDMVLCFLPGSRTGEVNRLLPIFKIVAKNIKNKQMRRIHVVMPAISNMVDRLKYQTSSWQMPVYIIDGVNAKYDAMAACNVALAASGTVALELAMAKAPTVIAYKFSPLTYFILSKLIKKQYAHLLNIILNKPIVPEYIQDDCTAENLTKAMLSLIGEGGVEQISKLKPALAQLQAEDNKLPSLCAADRILEILNNK